MLWEALEIMQRLWVSQAPFEFAGEYWHVSLPDHSELFRGPHLKAFQRPHPPIAIAGSSPRSSTLATAGAKGLEPVARTGWLCGSPDTVVELIQKMYEDTGGFGTLLLMTCDYIEQSEAYRRCFDLIAEEVIPRVKELAPAAAA
jgi:alkanesulfonate monooxygenase SsuD/methylene tetrahydromethanopterin reductase-like flavin-dependent oxidoreductase (luciferase family)